MSGDPAPIGCHVTVVGVRGSRESALVPDDGMGPAVSGLVDRVEEGLRAAGSAMRIDRVGLAYPARSFRYRTSRDRGVAELTALIGSVHDRDPAARVVIIGLSQGAEVARAVCAGLDDASREAVAALVLLGDPGRQPREDAPFLHGTTDATPGLLAARAPRIPPELWHRTWSHCLDGDRVSAARTGWLGAVLSGSHTSYASNADQVQDRAAAFVLERLRRLEWRRVTVPPL